MSDIAPTGTSEAGEAEIAEPADDSSSDNPAMAEVGIDDIAARDADFGESEPLMPGPPIDFGSEDEIVASQEERPPEESTPPPPPSRD